MMPRYNSIYAIIPTRSVKPYPKTLQNLVTYFDKELMPYEITVNSNPTSFYESLKLGFEKIESNKVLPEENDLVILAHDDIEILSPPDEFIKLIDTNLTDDTGFVGVAGAAMLPEKCVWWETRQVGKSRGFVFQGKDRNTMVPNYFGPHGEVVVLDGCFLATRYNTIKKLGLDKPSYLTDGWDYYDLHLTFTAYLEGLKNKTLPILIRHESIGQMRPEWYTANAEFRKHHRQNLPVNMNMEATSGVIC